MLIESSWSIVTSRLPSLLASMSPSKHLSSPGNIMVNCCSGAGVGPGAGGGGGAGPFEALEPL